MVNQYSTSDERKLVIKLIAGDEDAFCELYASYKARLIYFAMQFVKSPEFAEDVFHDAFTAIWQGRAFIDYNQSFSGYLYTIVRNRILNLLRDMSSEDELKQYLLENAIDTPDSAHQQVLANDLMQHIDYAVERLAPRQKEAFTLSRKDQLSHKEIAMRMGLSVNTVQEYISDSLKSIREYLKKNDIDVYCDIIILLFCLNI